MKSEKFKSKYTIADTTITKGMTLELKINIRAENHLTEEDDYHLTIEGFTIFGRKVSFPKVKK